MKFILTILISIVMLQQLLPVGQWLNKADAVHTAVCDGENEDAPVKKTADVKGDGKFWAVGYPGVPVNRQGAVNFGPLAATYLPSPLLEYTTPPPDAC